MSDLFVQFVALAGVAALVSAVVNVGKSFYLIPDGQASNVSAVLSTAAFIALVYLKIFVPSVDVAALDKEAAAFASFMLYALGYALELGLPSKFHSFLKDASVPWFGYSHSTE